MCYLKSPIYQLNRKLVIKDGVCKYKLKEYGQLNEHLVTRPLLLSPKKMLRILNGHNSLTITGRTLK